MGRAEKMMRLYGICIAYAMAQTVAIAGTHSYDCTYDGMHYNWSVDDEEKIFGWHLSGSLWVSSTPAPCSQSGPSACQYVQTIDKTTYEYKDYFVDPRPNAKYKSTLLHSGQCK